MKKIFLFIATVCALASCDPVEEDVSNGGAITRDQLHAKTTVEFNKTPEGKNGNMLHCETTAPVTAKWTIAGADFIRNGLYKKMTLGEHEVVLNAICADGTELSDTFKVTSEVVTNELIKVTIYDNPEGHTGAYGSGAAFRFSSTEGEAFRTMTDDEYKDLIGNKLHFIIKEASDGAKLTARNGWWSSVYQDAVAVKTGDDFTVTGSATMAAECMKGGDGKDLLLTPDGVVTISEVYYEK